MFFDLELALEALPELGERTREAMRRLLPGAVSLLLPNPAERFPLACGDDPGTLGLRVPRVERLAGRPLAGAPVERQPGGRAPTRAGSRTCPSRSAGRPIWCSTAASSPGRRRP